MIFLSQIAFAYAGFSLIRKYLTQSDLVNTGMYNLAMLSPQEIVHHLPTEMLQSVTQFFYPYTFLDTTYCVLMAVIFIAAIGITYHRAPNKWIYSALVLILCVVSRYAFILSARPDMAIVRLEYWGRLGLYVFALSILLNQTKQWIKNIVLLWGILTIGLFIKTDF